MAQAKEEHVAKLLRQGLELYGTGEIPRAFMLWNKALELDPGNEEALDYIRDADRRSLPRADREDASSASIVWDARRLVQGENEEAALELLLSAPNSVTLECESMVELLRAKVFRKYQDALGDLEKIQACGYGVDEAEGLEGIHCVSAVILDDYHYPIAAVTTIAPAFRLPPDRFEDIGQACIETAEVIRKKLLN